MRRHCNAKETKSSLFTLIELLVVLTTIFVLMGLLIPALDKAMRLTKETACKNNLLEQGYAISTYASDHNGFFPVSHDGDTTRRKWRTTGSDGLSYRGKLAHMGKNLYDNGYLGDVYSFLCPLKNELGENVYGTLFYDVSGGLYRYYKAALRSSYIYRLYSFADIYDGDACDIPTKSYRLNNPGQVMAADYFINLPAAEFQHQDDITVLREDCSVKLIRDAKERSRSGEFPNYVFYGVADFFRSLEE